MNNLKTIFAPILFLVCITSMTMLLTGCGEPEKQMASIAAQLKEKQRGLKFHRPKTLDEAVQRLSEIHEAVNSDGDLPAVRKFDYVEVIHGEGESGHSHYYSADSFDSAMEHDEEEGHEDEEHEKVERHTAEVDFRTEFADVVRWLPEVAAASDMSSSDWESVSDASKKMTQVLKSIPVSSTDSKLRESWKKNATEIETMLIALQSVLAGISGDGK